MLFDEYKTKQRLVSLALVFFLLFTAPAKAGKFGDFIESLFDDELPNSSVMISEVSFTRDSAFDGFISSTSTASILSGRVLNLTSDKTIKELSVILTVLACDSKGNNCVGIDEGKEYLVGGASILKRVNSPPIPPKQARFFENKVFYDPGSSKHIYYRYVIDKIIAK